MGIVTTVTSARSTRRLRIPTMVGNSDHTDNTDHTSPLQPLQDRRSSACRQVRFETGGQVRRKRRRPTLAPTTPMPAPMASTKNEIRVASPVVT